MLCCYGSMIYERGSRRILGYDDILSVPAGTYLSALVQLAFKLAPQADEWVFLTPCPPSRLICAAGQQGRWPTEFGAHDWAPKVWKWGPDIMTLKKKKNAL